MKQKKIRMLAMLLAFTLALPWAAMIAEETETGEWTADIEESLQTMAYDETVTRLERDADALVALMQSEDFKSIFGMEEVYTLTNDVLVEVLKWLIENRDVTMKILDALDVGENEKLLISVIWDSGERISEMQQEYPKTEEGSRVQEAIRAFFASEAYQQSVVDLLTLGKSEDFQYLVTALLGVQLEQSVLADNEAVRLALEEQGIVLDEKGMYVYQLVSLVMNSEWAKNSLPALMKEPTIDEFLDAVSVAYESEMTRGIREELSRLARNDVVIHYIAGLGQAALRLLDKRDLEKAQAAEQAAATPE